MVGMEDTEGASYGARSGKEEGNMRYRNLIARGRARGAQREKGGDYDKEGQIGGVRNV